MKTLFFIRHAKSSWDDTALPDKDRPLDDRGRRDAPKTGKRLAERDVNPGRGQHVIYKVDGGQRLPCCRLTETDQPTPTAGNLSGGTSSEARSQAPSSAAAA
jgi:hypothetical protein